MKLFSPKKDLLQLQNNANCMQFLDVVMNPYSNTVLQSRLPSTCHSYHRKELLMNIGNYKESTQCVCKAKMSSLHVDYLKFSTFTALVYKGSRHC